MQLVKLRLWITILCLFVGTQAFTTAYQPFFIVAYDNPADIYTTNQADLIFASSTVNGVFVFRGQNGPLTGAAKSDQTRFLPASRVDYRVNPDLVLGLDISHRVYGNTVYPVGSILQTSSTTCQLFDYDYSPRFSYKVNEKLFLGAGANFNDLYVAKLDIVRARKDLINQSSSWGYGWDAGLVFRENSRTIIKLSYFSQVNLKPTGTSQLLSNINNNFVIKRFVIPAVATLELNKKLTEKITIIPLIRYEFWDALKSITLYNTALGHDIYIPFHYTNALVFRLTGRYQITDKFTGILAIEDNTNPTPLRYRYPGLPTTSVLALAAGAQYDFTKNLTAKVIYAYLNANPPIDTVDSLGILKGKMNIRVNIVDFFIGYSF